MYKKFVRLDLSDREKRQVTLDFTRDLCVLEVVLIQDEHIVNLKNCRVRVEGVQSNNQPVFGSCNLSPAKNGAILLTLTEHFVNFNVPLLCELLIEEGGGEERWVFFYVEVKSETRKSRSDIVPQPKPHVPAKTRLIAHRGLSSIAPENTIPAYELAGRYGYYGAECDIHETKDGEFVILHNSTLEGMTNGVGKISDYTLKELQQLTIISGHQIQRYPSLKLPTLEEYLDVCKSWGIVPVIEVKEIEESSISRLIRLIKQWGDVHQVIIISFSKKTLVQIRKLEEAMTLQWLAHLNEENIKVCAKYKMAISCRYKEVTQKLVHQAHQQGVLVATWTVDLNEKMQELMKMGVDFITTNTLLYRQSLVGCKGGKDYLFHHQSEYINSLSSPLKEKGNEGWIYHEEGQLLEVFDEGEFGNVLEVKLAPLAVGDVVTVSFFYLGMEEDSIRARLEYVEEGRVQEVEHSIKSTAHGNWHYMSGQFLAMNSVSGDQSYYRVIIGPKAAGKSHFMIRDLHIHLDYM